MKNFTSPENLRPWRHNGTDTRLQLHTLYGPHNADKISVSD